MVGPFHAQDKPDEQLILPPSKESPLPAQGEKDASKPPPIDRDLPEDQTVSITGVSSSKSKVHKLKEEHSHPDQKQGSQTPKFKQKALHSSRKSLNDSGQFGKINSDIGEDGPKRVTTPKVSSTFKRPSSSLAFSAHHKRGGKSSQDSKTSSLQNSPVPTSKASISRITELETADPEVKSLHLQEETKEDNQEEVVLRRDSVDEAEESSSSLLNLSQAGTKDQNSDQKSTSVQKVRASRTSRHTSPSPGPFSKTGSGRTSPAHVEGGTDSGNTTPRSRSLSNLIVQQQQAQGDDKFQIIEEEKRPNILWCRVCELPIMSDEFPWEDHAQCQYHQRSLQMLKQRVKGKRQAEQMSLLENQCVDLNLLGPEDVNLKKQRQNQLKTKQRHIINNLAGKCLNHESAAITMTSREIFSQNRKQIQKLFRSLDQLITPNTLNYDDIQNILKDVVKILAQRKEADLHVFRRMKYIPCLMELIQKVNVVPKNQIKSLEKLFESVIRVISLFCSVRQNRLYLINSNRLLPLAKLLLWTLNRYHKDKFSKLSLNLDIPYLAPLIHILTQATRHKMLEIPMLRNEFLEYLLCSPLLSKIKFRQQSLPLEGGFQNHTTDVLSRISGFLESVTQAISEDARYRPVFDRSQQINTEIHYMLYVTEVGDILGLLTLALNIDEEESVSSKDIQKKLEEEEKKGSAKEEEKKSKLTGLAASSTAASSRSQLIPKRTTSIIAVNCLKTMNNVFRIDLDLAQMIWSSRDSPKVILQVLEHILESEPTETSAFDAAEELSIGSQIQMGNPETEEWMEMLHEMIVLIGYLSLLNKNLQDFMGKQKVLKMLCAKLPFRYFSEQKYQAILFPTLISLCFEHKRNTLQVDDSLSIEDYLVKYISLHMEFSSKLEGAEVREGSAQTFFMKRSGSVSSTASSNVSVQQDMANGISPYLSFSLRFPQKLWNRAVEFFRIVCSQEAIQ